MALSIEHRSIDWIPEHDRHGRIRDQVTFWFLGNFHFFTLSIGFVGPSLGLGFGYTTLAGALGILFGTVFVAFHASQGPELGLPQMIQSRAQFGYRGVVLVLLATLVMFILFNVADLVLMAHGLAAMLGWGSAPVILGATAIAILIAVLGHDWLHRIFRWCFWICLPLYLAVSVAIAIGHVPAAHPPSGGFAWPAFIAQFAASAGYNLTYAPSISDYSRYLPRSTRPGRLIAAVFAGATSSAIWLIALGAWLATRLGAADGLLALHDAGNALFTGFGVTLGLASVAALVATMGLNAYSGMLTVVTAANSLFGLRPSFRLRIGAILALAAAWSAVAFALSMDAIGLLFATLTVMFYLLVPWTAVNLTDYFFVRRGRYAITDLFDPRGIYGAWGWRGLVPYIAGFAVTWPFFVLPGIYVGPAARALGGLDVGWLAGLLVSGGSYLWLSRSFDPATERAAIAASERVLARGGPTG